MLPRLCLALLLFCLSLQAWAFTPVVLDSIDTRQSLGNGTFYLEDRTGRLDVDEILALPPERFRAVEGGHVNEGKNSSTWWLRAGLSNRLAEPLSGFIEINYPLLDHIELFLRYPDGSLSQQLTGDLHPFAERPVKVSNFWFPVNLPPGETTLLLRIKTTSTLYVPLYFSTYNASASQHEELNGLSGAFYGVLFAMFCYNLFLFASLREPAYFWYLVYTLNVGLFALSFDGFLVKWLADDGGWVAQGIYVLMFSHCLIAIQFSRHFLHTRELFPRLDLLLRCTLLAAFGSMISGLVLDVQSWSILASITVIIVSAGLLLAGASSGAEACATASTTPWPGACCWHPSYWSPPAPSASSCWGYTGRPW